MSTSRPQLPKGNKLFLPKIEYAKFTRETHLSGKRSSSKSAVTAEKDTEGVKDEQAIPLLDENYGMSSSFTRFSVLPPITKTFQATRRLNHVRRMSSGLFSSANGSSLASGSDANQNIDSTRTHGDSSTPASQEQQNGSSVSARRSPLQVVGNAYGKTGSRTLKGNRANFKSNPRRSFSSPGLSADEQTCEDCATLLRRARSSTEGDKIKERRDSTKVIYNSYKCKKHATEHNYVRRQNSENLGLQNSSHSGLLQDTTNPLGFGATKPRSSGNSFLDINATKARPVSRCEISFDMNEGGNFMRPPVQNTSDTSNRAGVSPPTIQIHPPDTEKLSEPGENSSTPQIQVLINSLDSAKEELPKSTIEVPYTSVREKRRRSALCRNNSKQVDDFLLVHNLRDLGLL